MTSLGSRPKSPPFCWLSHRHLQLKMSKTKLINFPLKFAFSYVLYFSEEPLQCCNQSPYLGARHHLGAQEIF